MDKFLNYMKLNGEEDDEYYDDDYLDDGDDDEPAVSRKSAKQRDDEYEAPKKQSSPAPAGKSTPIKQSSRKMTNAAGMEVCVVKPTSEKDSREITDTLLANRTVVLNLEGLDVDIAQRIIDFTSGSCYAIGGNLQKISEYIFIITPASVDISGDFQDIFGGSVDMPFNN